jgi:hypothetical protein
MEVCLKKGRKMQSDLIHGLFTADATLLELKHSDNKANDEASPIASKRGLRKAFNRCPLYLVAMIPLGYHPQRGVWKKISFRVWNASVWTISVRLG